MYTWHWEVILQYKSVFWTGALTTIALTLAVIICGTVLGVALGLMRKSSYPLFPEFAYLYTTVFRGLPILVLLIWIYYVCPSLLGMKFSPFICAFIALSINLAAYAAETTRAAIEAIPKHQFESGRTLGLGSLQTTWLIILPQALRNMLPNLLGLYITQLKNSSLASVIAVNELLHTSNILISNTYRPLEIYTTIAAVYLIMIIPVSVGAGYIEHKLAAHTSPAYL